MPRDVPPLAHSQQAILAETLAAWAEVHPRRYIALIQLADGSELTPEDIARAAAEPDTRDGQMIGRVFSNGIHGDPSGIHADRDDPDRALEQILGAYIRDTERWRGSGVER